MDLNISNASQTRKDYYVYHLIDPNNHQVFYVGKGCKSRMFAHEKCVINDNHCERNPLLFSKIKKILTSSQKIGYAKIQENLTESDAMTLEMSEIKKYGRRSNKTGILCNMTDGGEGMSGHAHSVRTKRYMSKLHSGTKNPFYGCRHTKNALQKISKAAIGNGYAKGMIHTRETLQKLSQMNRGKVVSIKTRKKMSESRRGRRTKIPILQVKENGTIVNRWLSASVAARQLHLTISCICDCLRGIQKTYKGYLWKYE